MLESPGRVDLMPVYTGITKKGLSVEDAKKDEAKDAVKPIDIPGIKTHICTLVSHDSTPHKWQDVYVHSKLMVIGNDFLINGSANINLRSMAFDTEIAIAVQDTAKNSLIPEVMKHLWCIHSKSIDRDKNQF
ncbi:phospholipase D-like domain-containing protein [Thorsellia kenyensis]|uniref:Phospholipase D-like domain-containing protein n=1 Tax=Thorsellia kenyensis TaxID=1549888 RepID=A0ABV6CAZ3_9GAMM